MGSLLAALPLPHPRTQQPLLMGFRSGDLGFQQEKGFRILFSQLLALVPLLGDPRRTSASTPAPAHCRRRPGPRRFGEETRTIPCPGAVRTELSQPLSAGGNEDLF